MLIGKVGEGVFGLSLKAAMQKLRSAHLAIMLDDRLVDVDAKLTSGVALVNTSKSSRSKLTITCPGASPHSTRLLAVLNSRGLGVNSRYCVWVLQEPTPGSVTTKLLPR